MKTNYPDWATEKQKEGMKKFEGVAKEYLHFLEITYRNGDSEDEHSFYA